MNTLPLTPLANRLSVYALNDLNRNCPRTMLALEGWLNHVGFWLADLASHPRTKDQVPFMISMLSINLAGVMGGSIHDARTLLRDEMVLRQAEEVIQ